MTMRPRAFSRMLKRFAGFVLAAFALAGLIACERTPDQASEAKKAVVADRPGVLHLTSEELSRTVIEVAPVARGELRVSREFHATVQANENELAEVPPRSSGAGWKGLVRRAQSRGIEPAPI